MFAKEELLPAAVLASLGIHLGSSAFAVPKRLKSQYPALDHLLDGGLPFGVVMEWGLPFGCGGHELLLHYLVSATRGSMGTDPIVCLWVFSKTAELKVFPPAWFGRGVDLNNIKFTSTDNPLRDLKPVFLSAVLKLVVMDGPKKLSKDDLAFIARQARANRQLVILTRGYLLEQERGNVWAKIRLNCWQDSKNLKRFHLQSIRGLAPKISTFEIPLAEGEP